MVQGIEACGSGRVVDEQRQACFAKHFPKQKSYSRIVSEVRAIMDKVFNSSRLYRSRIVCDIKVRWDLTTF